MKIVFHEAFYAVYASDPAADRGRMESIMRVIEPSVEVVEAIPATEDQIRGDSYGFPPGKGQGPGGL